MFLKTSFVFAFIFSVVVCNAQPKVIVITDSFFNNENHSCAVTQIDGWYFKIGNNPAWAAKDISLNTWKEISPAEIPGKDTANRRKTEAWLRATFRIDSNIKIWPVGIRSPVWAASDVYINGKLIASFGKTGSSELPYRENHANANGAVQFIFKPGEIYTIAIHYVDYIAPFPPHTFKSAGSYGNLLVLTTVATPLVDVVKTNEILYRSIIISVTGIISLLFLFFWFLNSKDKNQLLFALYCSFIFMSYACGLLAFSNPNLSFSSSFVYYVVFHFVELFILITNFVIITRILNYRVRLWLWIVLCSVLVAASFCDIIPALYSWNAIINGLYVILCAIILVIRWKQLHGAKWAVAIGLIISLACTFYLPVNTRFGYLLDGIAAVSFPIALMIYVALRFREVNREVQKQAEKVVRLSEEKKEQAINQQKILEEEVKIRTADLRKTLDNLKSTQAQLIQSEKMASLGELTAGIAHEIQNPLNFVNNFSDVNREMLEELKAERLKPDGERDDGLQNDLINNVIVNSEKINYHGKRADAIVKNMLQHSRQTKGVKEPVAINALCDEYLRLSYHGLRAKDKSFNADFKTDFDESIGKINIVPQDIGRVLLNLFNNAFYAVNEQKSKNLISYEPTVSVSTKKIDNTVEIKVKDNGSGIPKNVIDKIFQPFFTTKPTGSGTGLGLSLSYDIIKAHGGEIKVESKEGEGSTFIILIPTNA